MREKNYSDLTMFADYRVPQILAFFSVLKYSPKLEETLRSKVLLQPGSETEVEIREFSICAIDVSIHFTFFFLFFWILQVTAVFIIGLEVHTKKNVQRWCNIS